jgi:hypothetical protein
MPQIVIYKPQNCYPPQAPGTRVGFDRLRLKSGINHLSDVDFAKLKSHPAYQGYVDRKALVVQEPKEEVEVVPLSETPANLSAYNVDEAEDIIDNTHDLDVLKRWLSGETRVTTRRDLNQRIKDIEGGES